MCVCVVLPHSTDQRRSFQYQTLSLLIDALTCLYLHLGRSDHHAIALLLSEYSCRGSVTQIFSDRFINSVCCVTKISRHLDLIDVQVKSGLTTAESKSNSLFKAFFRRYSGINLYEQSRASATDQDFGTKGDSGLH